MDTVSSASLLDAVKTASNRIFFNPPFGFWGTDGGAGGAGGSGGDGGAGGDNKGGGGAGSGSGDGDKGDKGNQNQNGNKDDKGGNDNNTNVTLGPDGKPWDPERAGRTIALMREERKTEKQEFEDFKNKHADQMDKLAKALGFKEDEEITPEKFREELGSKTSRISTLEGENRQLALQLQVDRVSRDKNAIGELVWAHLQSTGALKDIDLASKDLKDQIGTHIDEALKSYPQLRRSGFAPKDAGAGGDNGDEPKNVNEMIRRAAGRR